MTEPSDDNVFGGVFPMPENPRCWLIMGPWRSRYDDPTHAIDDMTGHGVHRLVDVEAVGGRATRVVSWNQLRDNPSVYHLTDGVIAAEETVTYIDLTVAVHGSRPIPDAMPLALLAPDTAGWLVYLPIRLGGEDALFHRLDTIEATTPPQHPPTPAVLAHTLRNLPAYSQTAGSHECWYFKQDPDIEYEHKITLDVDIDIYALARDINTEIRRGGLSGYRAEYRNDFELWQFGNHLFDITGPTESDRGYASFIPRLNGGYTVKRKQFATDGFARYERKLDCPHELATTAEMSAYLTGHLHLDANYLGSFDRIRFDNMLENSDTGHIYSLMTDRCTVTGNRAVLQQLEIEYFNSRGDRRQCRAEIIDELHYLKTWTQQYLHNRNIPASSDYTSKYTFLRNLSDTAHHPQ
ncbi:hypothetical protein [Nocardia sp. NPDC059691]|uniref:hypothetical protein n=1 Tax=Nocardia sp. NPDC059691 TaxID=3346908 RepID=UPI0036947AE1